MSRRALLCTILLPGFLNAAEPDDLPLFDSTACQSGPIAEFGRYIGRWTISDSRLDQDGQGWSPGSGAQWTFVCVGGGTAVQDFWMPADGGVGTNLRTYNPEKKRWDIAWAVDGVPGFAHIVARRAADDTIVMFYESPQPTPQRRITFYPPDASGWDWKLEISADGGTSWTEVYRIRATPAADE